MSDQGRTSNTVKQNRRHKNTRKGSALSNRMGAGDAFDRGSTSPRDAQHGERVPAGRGTGSPGPSGRILARESMALPDVISFHLVDDGTFPNSPMPLLLFPRALQLTSADPAAVFERVFALNGWRGSWRNGIYDYHHYHSTAHEVLGIFAGSATVQFGGDRGPTRRLQPGDVVVIPAGVAHKNLGSEAVFGVVGAYPDGQEWDLCRGKAGERPKTDRNIAQVQLPAFDPVYGQGGPLRTLWPVASQR